MLRFVNRASSNQTGIEVSLWSLSEEIRVWLIHSCIDVGNHQLNWADLCRECPASWDLFIFRFTFCSEGYFWHAIFSCRWEASVFLGSALAVFLVRTATLGIDPPAACRACLWRRSRSTFCHFFISE